MEHLPAIDLELGAKLAGNNPKAARELLAMLMETLATDFQEIQTLHQQGDLFAMSEKVHRLHGATCYCGVPALRYAIANLSAHLKEGKASGLNQLFSQFSLEIKRVLAEYEPA